MRCLFPDCKNQKVARGLCRNHYNSVSMFVKGGLTTWEELEKQGKTAPQKKNKITVRDWILSNDNTKNLS